MAKTSLKYVQTYPDEDGELGGTFTYKSKDVKDLYSLILVRLKGKGDTH